MSLIRLVVLLVLVLVLARVVLVVAVAVVVVVQRVAKVVGCAWCATIQMTEWAPVATFEVLIWLRLFVVSAHQTNMANL